MNDWKNENIDDVITNFLPLFSKFLDARARPPPSKANAHGLIHMSTSQASASKYVQKW